MHKNKNAFTIVELLIVIVIIGILAVITIVAYNGITSRAQNTKTVNAVAAYSKVITTYAAEKGSYPPLSNYPCLGNVSFCGNVSDTTGGCDGAGRGNSSNGLNNELTYLATNLPEPSTQAMDCNGKNYSGAWYYSGGTNKTATTRIYFKGDVGCPTISGLDNGTRFQATNTTACRYNFPLLP